MLSTPRFLFLLTVQNDFLIFFSSFRNVAKNTTDESQDFALIFAMKNARTLAQTRPLTKLN